jgi:CRISPR-associated protein (TIGR03984 family)
MYNPLLIQSTITELSGIFNSENLSKHFLGEDAKAVIWYYDKIEFYQLSNNNWDRPLRNTLEDEVVRIRIFNKDKEVHIWRSKNKLIGRLRVDFGQAEPADGNLDQDGKTLFVTANQILNGTSFDVEDNFLKVTENKGTEYHLPFSELLGMDKTDNRLVLITRNYIDYNEIGQAGYVDSRFLNIISLK